MNSEKKDAYAVLKIKDFRNFLVGRFLGVVGIQIQAVIVGWQVYEITKDPLSLGLIGLAEIVPSISVSLFAGHIADKVSRRTIIVSGFSVLFLCSLSLLTYSLGIIPILSNNTNAIYTTIFISGIARGFLGAAVSSFMAQLVHREYYHNSAAWNGTVWQIAAVTGPFLGGMLYRFNGAILAYSVDAALMLLAVFFFSMVVPKPIPVSDRKEGFVDSLLLGFRFVFKNPVILGAITLDMFAVLFGGAVALLPIFASDILKVGPEGLGLLRAAPSVGAALMAAVLAYYPPKEYAGKILLWCVAGFGISMLCFGISTNFYISLLILAVSGVFDSVSVIVRSTILQTFTPDEMRGRVAAVSSIFIGSSNELGAFESGVAAKLMGTVTSVIFGGCMTILVVGNTAIISPTLRALNFNKINEAAKK
jgi:MFS family permease